MNIDKMIEDGIITCNDCYYCASNCHDRSINCEDETGLCDDFLLVMVRADMLDELTSREAVWYADCLDHVYPVSIRDIDSGTVYFTNGECEELSTYGETWGLWDFYPERADISKQLKDAGENDNED